MLCWIVSAVSLAANLDPVGFNFYSDTVSTDFE